MKRGYWAIALCLAVAGGAAAQGLGDAARKAREKREQRKATDAKPAPVIDEATLAKGREQPSTLSVTGASGSQARSSEGSSGGQIERPPLKQGGSGLDQERAERERDETYWRGRVRSADERLERAERGILDARKRLADARGLSAQLSDSGASNAEMAQASADIQKRIAELNAAEAELTEARQTREDLDEEARRAGALPGWLR